MLSLALLPLTLSLLLTPSTATPTPILAPRACTTQYASTLQQISQASPTDSFPPSATFTASQSGPGSHDSIDTLVAFTDIPAGSYGCQLAVKFPADYPVATSGAALLSVYALPDPIAPDDTYADYYPAGGRGIPKGAYLFGSVTIDGGSSVINSKVCSENLSFLFAIASENQAGETTFVDAGSDVGGPAGFYLTYNC